MGLDDAKAHRQANTRADSGGLRGEIGLEHTRAQIGRYAEPIVGDRDAE
jgi:hypothetical protein